ncbi:hypothetical protein RLV03_000376 [Salmonella enterica subsp. enterica serovar Benin]|nr:hypothetical protein [Salmonella enterica]ELD8107730.1 hypothetical protein [Salmonella enterica subsp. enterica serovar Benin]ELD9381933.1 hypothetical protein [Salmonella enterica subsp. enterica serovar Benin]ELQ8809626.1 hypothetical protein [Salmonella enterica]
MNNIIPVVTEIENILQGADRPEKTLYQRYCTSGAELRETFVLAMIGKLIEQNRRLQSGASRAHWMTY